MAYDYSNAPPPREFDLIPAGTVASVTIKIRPGNAGESGLLKRSKDGGCEMLDIEYTVVDGEYARRKFWANMILEGTTAGHAQAAEISRSTLRAIIESARGVMPDDMSPEARASRIADLKDFDGLTFIAKIGIEKGQVKNNGSGEKYSDKNILIAAITPDKKRDWHPVDQPPARNDGGGAAARPDSELPLALPVKKPDWAD
jgi:hypothetical protein